MGPTWGLSAPGGPHVGHMNLVIRWHMKNVHWETYHANEPPGDGHRRNPAWYSLKPWPKAERGHWQPRILQWIWWVEFHLRQDVYVYGRRIESDCNSKVRFFNPCNHSFEVLLNDSHIGFYWIPSSWWSHQMETLSVLLAIGVGNSKITGEFPAQRPVARNFKVFFDLRLNKRLSKQWWGRWFEAPSRP